MEQQDDPSRSGGDDGNTEMKTERSHDVQGVGESAGSLLTKSAAYSFAMYISKFTDAIGGLLVAKFLGPTMYGYRNAFGLAVRYEELTEFGTYVAVNRVAPYHRGRGDTALEAEMRNSVFAVNIFYAAVACAACIIGSILLARSGVEQVYVDLSLFFGIVILSGRLLRYQNNELKIDKRMFDLSKATILKSVMVAGVGPAMAFVFGLRGLLIALVCSDVITILYLLTVQKVIPSFRNFKIEAFWKVLKIGFPMMVVLTLGLLLRSSDRLVILSVLSATALGYYGFAVMAVVIVTTIPTVIHSVTLAPIMEEYGASQDRAKISKYLDGPTVLMAYFLPFVIAALYFSIEVPIAWFFAEYMDSVLAIKILILSAYLQAIATPSSSILFALDKQLKVIVLMVPLVLLSVGVSFAVLSMGFGIDGVAIGVCCVYFILVIVMTLAASREFSVTIGRYCKFLVTILSPVLYAIALVVFLEYSMARIDNLLYRSAAQIASFMVAYIWIILPVRNHFALTAMARWLRGCLPFYGSTT